MTRTLRGFLVLALFSPACGGSAPTGPSSTPTTPAAQTSTITYGGTFSTSQGISGAINLTATVPVSMLSETNGLAAPRAVATATGTLKPVGGGVIPLTGTYDTVTRKFEVKGADFTISATITTETTGDVLNGTVTGGGGQGAVVAAPAPATGALTTFCGTYTGDTHGTLVMVRREQTLYALVSEAGAPADFSITGTITGTAVFFKFDWAPPDVGSTTVTGTIDGGIISGTWVANSVEPGRGAVVERGDWIVRAGWCPL
jgi:hypothetical protein